MVAPFTTPLLGTNLPTLPVTRHGPHDAADPYPIARRPTPHGLGYRDPQQIECRRCRLVGEVSPDGVAPGVVGEPFPGNPRLSGQRVARHPPLRAGPPANGG